MGNEKVYVLQIYFKIATFLKRSVYISSWICKNIAARISLEAGRSPASSQCGRLKPRGLNVKASTQTQPRYWPVGGWVARCCVSKAQPVGRVVFGHLFYTLNVVLNNYESHCLGS